MITPPQPWSHINPMCKKICPYMSHRSSPGYSQEVECIEKRCAIYEKCHESYKLIDIADEKLNDIPKKKEESKP